MADAGQTGQVFGVFALAYLVAQAGLTMVPHARQQVSVEKDGVIVTASRWRWWTRRRQLLADLNRDAG